MCPCCEKRERHWSSTTPVSLLQGATLLQQIEIAKLQAARSMEDCRFLDNDYVTSLVNIQSEIDTQMEFAKMWEVKDCNDLIILWRFKT